MIHLSVCWKRDPSVEFSREDTWSEEIRTIRNYGTNLRAGGHVLGRPRANDESFDALYRSTWHRAVGSAHRVVHDRSRAEELAQEAFTRAFDRWSRVSSHPAPDAWVLRVTINLAIDSVRRRTPELLPPADRGHEDETVASLEVRRALAKLPGKQRQAIALRYLAQCEEADIASAMGCGRGTVKTHLARGMQNLRAQFAPDELPDLGNP